MKKKIVKTLLLIAVFIGISVYSYMNIFNSNNADKGTSPKQAAVKGEMPYNDFITKVNDKQVKEVEFDLKSPIITGELSDGTKFTTANPQTNDFKKYLLEHDIKVKAKVEGNGNIVLSLIGSIINFAIMIGILMFITTYLSKKMLKNQTTIMDTNIEVIKTSDLTFDDVAGNDEAKEDMMELVEFLKNPVKYKRYGATIPKGTILEGDPGTGKTLLAKALAGTAGVPFIAMSGSDFVEKFVGVGASRVRQLFDTAKKNAPCIVFIDEIDAVGKQRGATGGSNDERDQTLNQLLVEMDGFSGSEGIIVIAATNRVDVLDSALLRSGRFDRRVKIELPDVDARYEILKIHTKNKPLSEDVDLREIAKMTTYMSGADLANVMNEASIYAARFGHKGILMSDIDRAINKIIAGEEKKNRKNITRKDKEITAYHEAGHALVAKLLTKKAIPKVTIIPTTKGAGGYTLISPEEGMYETKKDMINDIAVSLGGRIAEELIFGKEYVTGGASQDLKMVTRTAGRMVKDYGMSENIGLINVRELYGDSYTGSTNDAIANEVKVMVEKIYKETKTLMNENKAILHNMAQALLQKETIFEADVDAIVNGIEVEINTSNSKIDEGGVGYAAKGEAI